MSVTGVSVSPNVEELEPVFGAQLPLQVAHDGQRALEARGPFGIVQTHAARNVDQDR